VGATAMDWATAMLESSARGGGKAACRAPRGVTEGCAAFGGWAATNRHSIGRDGPAVVKVEAMGRDGERYVAATLEGFIQQLAVSYVKNGYVFYVTGRVPAGKDPREVDRKLVEKYGVGVSKWVRARRKRAGLANVQYLRFERHFVLLATHGEHPFFEQEAGVIRDCRRVPIKFGGYAVSHRGGHASVRIEREQYNLLKAYFLDLAVRRSAATLESLFHGLPFEPYAPVRRQLFGLLRAVNRARKAAGFEPVSATCLRLRRRVLRPFVRADPIRRVPENDRARPKGVGGRGGRW